MHTEYLDYTDGSLTCEGYVAYDDSSKAKRPCVIVAHAWDGQNDVIRRKAEELAQLGYVGFALDMFGKGVRGNPTGDNSALIHPFLEDRALLRRRICTAVATAKRHQRVDAERIGAMGYCFGGLCVLDLARSGEPGVRGVVSLHGLFHPPKLGKQAPISAKVLILHGYADPMAPPDQMLAIAQELTDAQADWQLHAYGHAMHAFTHQAANAPERGLKYDAAADRRSWQTTKNFFEEVL